MIMSIDKKDYSYLFRTFTIACLVVLLIWGYPVFSLSPYPANTVNAAPLQIQVQPNLSIDDPTVAEGDSGTTAITFRVTLSSAPRTNVTVNFATQDGTATAGGRDYVPVSGTLTFTTRDISLPVTVQVV